MRRNRSFRYSLTIVLLFMLYYPSFGTSINDKNIEKRTPPTLVINTTISSQACDTGIATLCYTIMGGAEPYVVSCQDQNATIYPATGMCFENLPPGTYTISATDAGTDSGTTTVVISQPLTILVNNTSATSCFGSCDGIAEISVSGGEGEVTYLNNGVLFNYPEDFNTLCAGNYTLTAIDENSCSTNFDFLIVEPQEIIASISTINVTCTGMNDGFANVAFNEGGSPPLTIDYETENIDFSAMEIGDYPFTITDSHDCVVRDTIHMVADIETDFALSTFTTPVSCWNEKDGTATALITGGVTPISIQWNDDLNQSTEIAIGLTNKQYTVVVTDNVGCTYTEKVYVDLTVGCLFIADALTPNNDGFNDVWNIGGLEFFPEAVVQVFNRWGQLVFESKGYNLPWNGTYLGNKLPIADYYYVITNNGTDNAIHGTVTIKY